MFAQIQVGLKARTIQMDELERYPTKLHAKTQSSYLLEGMLWSISYQIIQDSGFFTATLKYTKFKEWP